MSRPLDGTSVLVTGGSRGLGRAMVQRFVRDGADVIFSYRGDAAAAEEVVARAEGHAHAVQADLSTLGGVRALFEAVDVRLGGRPLHGVVASAGVIAAAELEEVDEASFDRLFDLNVKGAFFTAQAAAQRMAGGGRIVFVGTGLTRFVMSEYLVYSATKDALGALTRGMAARLGPRGITVNTLAPGAIDTDMNPWLRSEQGIAAMRSMTALDRVGHADDIADVAAFLMSSDSRWVTGQRIEASGGQRL